jgi:hypothetical protein
LSSRLTEENLGSLPCQKRKEEEEEGGGGGKFGEREEKSLASWFLQKQQMSWRLRPRKAVGSRKKQKSEGIVKPNKELEKTGSV